MTTVVPPTFARLLRRYRQAAGLTQEALAERANLSARAVSDLERGLKTTPRRDTVELLAQGVRARSRGSSSAGSGRPSTPRAESCSCHSCPEAQTWLDEFLTRSEAAGASPAARAQALFSAGALAYEQGSLELALRLLGQALALAREAGDERCAAVALYHLGKAEGDRGNYEQSDQLLEESVAIYRKIDDEPGVCGALHARGTVARYQGHFTRATALCEEARELDAQSLALFREVGDRRGAGGALMQLADVAREQSDHAQALVLYKESLTLHRTLNTELEIARCWEQMARLACARGQAERAARLDGAAAALRDAMQSTMAPADRVGYDRDVAMVRERMGDEGFATAETEGRAMSLEQAVDYTLEEDSANRRRRTRR